MIDRWFESGWTLHTLTTTEDDWGNVIETWTTGASIMGRFRPLSGDRKLSADKKGEFADAKFYCAATSAVAVGDQIRKSSEHYEVTFVQNVMDMDRFLQVEVRRL